MVAPSKKIGDLPRFRVTSVAPTKSEQGYFAISGMLSRTEGVNEGRCSFIVPGDDVLTAFAAYLTLGERSQNAIAQIRAESQPSVMDLELIYVPPMWDPTHVWMVAEPRWKWQKTIFHATDAISRRFKDDKISIVNGEEITEWVEIKEEGKETGRSRYYPVFPSGKHPVPAPGPDGIIAGGWNHTHCELCKSHIDDGTFGYLDLGDHWLCDACHFKYVEPHDLSFLFE